MDDVTGARPLVRVAIAVGSNLGDRRAHLEYTVDALSRDISNLKVSEFVDTEPVGVAPGQENYLNGAAVGVTALTARALLDRLLDIERERGRTRPHPLAARTLDLDLILYGAAIIDEEGLIVPHPRFRHREFVLRPLSSIAPDMIDPITGKTVRDLLAALR